MRSGEDDAMPSLQDIQSRGQTLRERVEKIVRSKLDEEDAARVQELLATLDKATDVLVKGKNELEETEQKLMLQTGEFLLAEEELVPVESEAEQIPVPSPANFPKAVESTPEEDENG